MTKLLRFDEFLFGFGDEGPGVRPGRPKADVVLALAGNPNSGKTTVFNALTGSRRHVGNYPGVTVECAEGFRRHGDVELRIVDLPGTYSLTAHSAEELLARNFILNEKPDVVVDILDASNLERNLYLAVQIMELGVPLVLAFNMSDMAEANGFEFDIDTLSWLFGVRIVQTVGTSGKGLKELLDAVVLTARRREIGPARQAPRIGYRQEIEEEIAKVAALVEKTGLYAGGYDPRWAAVKLLENDRLLRAGFVPDEILAQLGKSAARIEAVLGEPPATAIAGCRYGYISGACREAVRSSIEVRKSFSDRVDAVVTNRVLGIPIFLGLMYLVFHLTFTVGGFPVAWIEESIGRLGDCAAGWWPEGSESVLKSLLVDGIIGGIGSVVVFLPNIFLLFLAIAFLEDSGYMARAAFLMDRVMHKVGLHGKSFIPMLIGFGCSVPAIMATRMLENRRDRLATILVIPLMSCGARLPIYALILPTFFPQAWQAPLLWIVYVIGILLAMAGAKILRATILKGESVPFVMELPPYRMPTFRGVAIHIWERGRIYLRKAGSVILCLSVLLWAISTFPRLPAGEAARFDAAREFVRAAGPGDVVRDARIAAIDNEEWEASLRHSLAGRIGRAMEPLLAPMGFDWRTGTALVGAFAAKEVFVAQLGIVFSMGETDQGSVQLRDRLREAYTPLAGFCIMLFCLVSAPCMVTVAVTRREAGSWKWALLQLGGLTLLAYALTTLVFQTGSLLGIGTARLLPHN
jgi:ferrous iron transport protein B